MTKATSTSTSPRRGMLAGTAAALLGAVSLASGRSAAAGESQDSELRILCAEFHRTQAELDRWHATGFRLEPLGRKTEAYRLWEAENDRFFWANHDALEAVRNMPAKTQAGIVAKSKVLAEQMDRVVVNLDGSMRGASNHEIFAYKLVQNTMQIGGRPGVNLCAPPGRDCVEPVVVTGEHAIINPSAPYQFGDLMALASIRVPYVGRQTPRYEALEPPRRTASGIKRLDGGACQRY